MNLLHLSYHWRDPHCSVPSWARCSTKSHLRQNKWQIDSTAPDWSTGTSLQRTHTHILFIFLPITGYSICQAKWVQIFVSQTSQRYQCDRTSSMLLQDVHTHSTDIFTQLHARTFFFLSQKCINLPVDWFFGIDGTMTCGCLKHWKFQSDSEGKYGTNWFDCKRYVHILVRYMVY